MGKIRKRKLRNNSVNVLEQEIEEEIPMEAKENAIQTILDQLQAANVEEKYCGLQTFALLIERQENVGEVSSRGVVRTVAPLLVDPASSVRNAAAGALRNLSAGGHEVCERLMEQDIMTPLTCFFGQFAESWVPDPSSKNVEEPDTLIQCVNLLWNLCESSELAIKYLGQSNIINILVRYLDLTVFGSDILIAVLQCLFVVIEDNKEAIDKIKSTSELALQQLISLDGCEPNQLLIKTLATGVTINLCGGNIVELPNNTMNRLMINLKETLSVDHRQACNQLSSAVPLRDGNGKINALKGKEAQILDDHLKSVSLILEAQQSSIEIIANLCSSADCDDSIEESSDSEDMGDEEICSNGNSDLNNSVLAEDKLPTEIIEAMVSLELFDKIWTKTQLPAENVMDILKEFDGSVSIHQKSHNLQTRALLCINNMLSSLPIENLGGVNGVYKLWVDAGKLVFKSTSQNTNLLESATAVMRAALDRIKCGQNIKSCDKLFSDLALTDIEIIVNGIKECQIPEIRSNLIRMIGTLALLLVNTLNETTANVICAITEFILDQAHRENEVWVLAEAIDTIVDLYSEDETDGLAAKVKLVDKLTVLVPILKNKARQQRKLPQEHKVLVSTAISNLPRFIKYKKSRLSH